MVGLSLFVEMVSTSFTLPWHGEIGRLARPWNLFGHLRGNMLSGKARQRSRSSARTSRFVIPFGMFFSHRSAFKTFFSCVSDYLN